MGVGTGPIAGETGPRCGSRAGRCQQLHQHNVRTKLRVSKNSVVSQFFPERLERRLDTCAFSPSRHSPNSSRTHPNGVALEHCYMRWLVQLPDHAPGLGAVGLGRHSRAALGSPGRRPARIPHALDFSQRPSGQWAFPGLPEATRLQGSCDGQISAKLRGLQRASEIRVGYHAPGEQS